MRDTNPSTDSCDDTTNNDWDFSRLPADETIAHDEFVLPPELLEERRWLVYRIQKRHGKYTKVPYAPFFSPSGNLKYSGTASPEDWTGFSSASAFVELTEHELGPQAVNGTGFVFTDSDDIMGVDLDHCVNQETGEIERWALEIVRELDSYTEFSQSRCRSTTSRNTNKPERVTVEPTDVIVIEGILALYDDELNDMFDLPIYVQTDADIRILQRIQRDVVDRDRDLQGVLRTSGSDGLSPEANELLACKRDAEASRPLHESSLS